MGDDERDGDPEVVDRVHTVCHLCGGGGVVADPKLAVVAGQARLIDNGRPCSHCGTVGQFPGIVPPV
ncbi:hypothetical protein ACOBQX_06375 [Actinokineospora sp. G85]|uniref:hypothetical protein n=1 Tax=Actinokineospora sp. G85 TaxID=3406626 RepID=UPI003C724EE5